MGKYSPVILLDCGCIFEGFQLESPCGFHYENQPKINDPLDKHLKLCNIKLTGEPQKFTEFEFLNDGKKPVHVRTTTESSPNNPRIIERLEMKKLYIKQKGFLKLWDYEKYYHILVV